MAENDGSAQTCKKTSQSQQRGEGSFRKEETGRPYRDIGRVNRRTAEKETTGNHAKSMILEDRNG
jgi:hypothetical protein